VKRIGASKASLWGDVEMEMWGLHDDPRLIADQLGQTVDVNQNVYTKASVARRKVAVDALESALPVM
jgi:hypothetical protein